MMIRRIGCAAAMSGGDWCSLWHSGHDGLSSCLVLPSRLLVLNVNKLSAGRIGIVGRIPVGRRRGLGLTTGVERTAVASTWLMPRDVIKCQGVYRMG